MIEEGSKVYWPNNKIKGDYLSGTVVEIVEGRAYIEQSNRVEVDFNIKDLLEEDPRTKNKSGFLSLQDRYTDIEINSVLSALPQVAINAVGALYNDLPFRVTDFENITPSQKMNYLCVMTSVSFEDIQEAVHNNKIGTIMVIMAINLRNNLGLGKHEEPREDLREESGPIFGKP